MIVRSIIGILIIVASFVVPWWSVALAAGIATFRYRHYVEVLLIGLLLDMLYMQVPWQYVFTLGALVLFTLAHGLHAHIRHEF